MAIVLQPAVKLLKPIKVLSYGPTYSGKTLSSLKLAAGIVMSVRKCTEQEAYKHIVLIDTEYGRGALHNKIGPYNYLQITAPYDTNKLVKMVNELSNMDQVDVIIADSLTHFWVKEGGILDEKSAKDKQGGNSYANWLDYTAKFNKMLDALLSSPKHILTTARAKSDTAIVDVDGRKVPKSYGLKPELREGIEFDFDIVFNIDKETHSLIVDKGVPGMDNVYEIATPTTGQVIFDLFNADSVVPEKTIEDLTNNLRNLAKNHNMITFMQLQLSGRKLDELSKEDLIALEVAVLNEIKKTQKK